MANRVLKLKTDKPTVEVASHADIERLVNYGERFWEETGYFEAGVGYDFETVTDMTAQLIDEGVVLYAETQAGEIVALMLVIIGSFPMNRNFTAACEWVFYVDPAYRRGGLGIELLMTAETILKQQKVKFFTMVSLANVTPEAANKLYQSLGFEHSETNYTKDLSWQPLQAR